MLLSNLVKSINFIDLFGDAEISAVHSTSKARDKNWLFICNEKEDKKLLRYVDEAIVNGAAAVAVCKKIDQDIPQIVCADIRRAYSHIAAAFYGDPQKELKIIGVVGTNGKTTTTRICGEVFNACGVPTAVIGTLGASFKGREYPLDLTTPDPEDFFALIRQMKDDGAEVVVTEYSAHAIYYKKLDPVFFEALIFTNCTQDHLDFFKDMESYAKVKKSIFTDENCKFKIINADDQCGRELIAKGLENTVAYGIKNPAEVLALRIKIKASGTSFFLNAFDSVEHVSINLLGLFNVYNALAAIALSHIFDLPLLKVVSAIKNMQAVSGRLERVGEYNGATVYIDYAHTPDGLENALLTLSKITERNLVCLFGCGGNRDKGKRAAMGRVAGDIADFVVVTTDNPRYEDADRIMSEIERGVREASLDYILIKDREKAIRYAVSCLTEGDVLLVAGKGAEEYQEIMGEKREFSDKAVIKSIVEGKVAVE